MSRFSEFFKVLLITPLLSRWLQKLQADGKVGIWFRGLVAYAQWQAERESRQSRLETVKRDKKWLEALGFVGRERK